MMRIITGTARGIKLNTLEGDETRPTAERVKEAVFSMLQFDIEGREVLDLFSGSGQMALEAVSRGASHAVLVDRSPKAIKIIEENVEKTRLREKCSVKRCDCIDYIKQNAGRKFDIIFIDPPYASGLYGAVLNALYSYRMLKGSTLIICESDFSALLDNDPLLQRVYSVQKTSKYSKTVVTVLGVNSEVESDG